MIALPAPVVVQCVQPTSPQALQAKSLWDVQGPAARVDALLEAASVRRWADSLEDETRGDQRHVVLRVKETASYRDIGGFIYRAQSSGLTIASRFDPPICEKN